MHTIINHPLIKDKLTRMRKAETVSTIFRENLKELSTLLAYEATKNMPLVEISIDTPIKKNAIGYKLENKITIVPILRAGLGMVDGLKALIPTSAIGHVGLYRDEETLECVEYFYKMPVNISNSHVLVLDPMLATGNSAIKAIELIKKENPLSITFIGIVGSPEGLKKLEKVFPDVHIYLGALDDRLNDRGYIEPGLGDAGDRIFGTK